MTVSVPHDGNGLATAMGGPVALASHLDRLCAERENASAETQGHYAHILHEMTEARDMRTGMMGLSNQPAHHIPFMYAFAGRHARTQELTRDALRRLFRGSEIGQGYPGDEDNGEMSAWYLFAALGFYPLMPGTTSYVLTSPLFERALVNLEGGNAITVIRHVETPGDTYIQSVRVNGREHTSISIEHETLASGCTIEFDLGPRPSSWAQGTTPPSQTPAGGRARVLSDVATLAPGQSRSRSDLEALVDDSGKRTVSVAPGEEVIFVASDDVRIELYTVSCGDDTAGAISGWTLAGSDNREVWQELDRRDHQVFSWPNQTRPFLLPADATFTHYRFRNEGTAPGSVAQIELLGVVG